MSDAPSLNPLTAFVTFGGLLKYLRRRARLSQRALSIALGYSASQVSRLESNLRTPDQPTLAALFAPALHIENEPDILARLLELAAQARGEIAPETVTGASGQPGPPAAAAAEARPAPAPPSNLPVQLTSFIGREKEMAAVQRLLTAQGPDAARLVTLTGTGGTGKTRLALQVATAMLAAYPDGVWLVELAPVSNSAAVPAAVATALEIRAEAGRPPLASLVSRLRAKHLLLLLDNCEHLIDASAQLAETLLSACPSLQILATSREALAIAGEIAFQVPTLSLPELGSRPAAETSAQSEAVRLFVDRARTALPGFELTEQNAADVEKLCRQLDGIPLAIELAAVRIKMLTVEQIAARLAERDRFRLLTGGSRTAPPQHQTLSALIDWSYDLLPEPERLLLRRLSVFRGGWTLDAAEAMAADEPGGSAPEPVLSAPPAVSAALPGAPSAIAPIDVLDLLTHLVDKSLVLVERKPRDQVRYQMLETIRQYAWEKVLEAGTAEALHARHLDLFLRLAEEAEPKLYGPEQMAWLERLETEHDNLRAALEHSRVDRASDEAQAGLRLAVALLRFWHLRGHYREAHLWLEEALARRAVPERSLVRAQALYTAANLASEPADLARARAEVEESIEIFRETGAAGQRSLAYALILLGNLAHNQDDFAPTLPLVEEGIALFREIGDKWGLALALSRLAATRDPLVNYQPRGDPGSPAPLPMLAPAARNDHSAERALYEESLALFRELGDRRSQGLVLGSLAQMVFCQGDRLTGRVLYEECLAIQQEFGDKLGIASCLAHLGTDALAHDDLGRATTLYAEGLALFRGLTIELEIAWMDCLLGEVARRQGDYGQAAQLLADSQALRQTFGNRESIAALLDSQARLAWSQAGYAAARSLEMEALAIRLESGHPISLAHSFEALAILAAAQRQPERAARLFGAAEPYHAALYYYHAMLPIWRSEHRRSLEVVRARLGEPVLAQLRAEGQAMTLEQAVAYALKP